MAMMDMFAGKAKSGGGKPQAASKGGLYMKPAVTTGRAADRTTREIVAKAKSGQGTLTYTPRKGPRGR